MTISKQRGTRALLVAILMLSGGSAYASPITETLDFTASGFGAGAPVDPVTGSVTITFDPTLAYNDASAGITLNGLNIALGSSIAFNYSPGGIFDGLLTIGGSANGADAVGGANDDFAIDIGDAGIGGDSFLDFLYAQAGDTTFSASGGSVTVASPLPAPEPATLVLFGSALLGLAAARRRKRL